MQAEQVAYSAGQHGAYVNTLSSPSGKLVYRIDFISADSMEFWVLDNIDHLHGIGVTSFGRVTLIWDIM